MPLLEICVADLESALTAERGGADRIELCADIACGGVTPSAGTIAVACDHLSIPVHALIRPRAGNFTPTPAEFEAMALDIAAVKSLRAAGVVLGLLNPDGTVDTARTARLISAARPLSVTFHKAFDAVPDADAALNALIHLGVDRLLTSGGAPTARAGLDRLRHLHQRAAGRLTILAGGRVTADDIPALLAAGLDEVHVGSAACVGPATDAEAVRRLRTRLAP